MGAKMGAASFATFARCPPSLLCPNTTCSSWGPARRARPPRWPCAAAAGGWRCWTRPLSRATKSAVMPCRARPSKPWPASTPLTASPWPACAPKAPPGTAASWPPAAAACICTGKIPLSTALGSISTPPCWRWCGRTPPPTYWKIPPCWPLPQLARAAWCWPRAAASCAAAWLSAATGPTRCCAATYSRPRLAPALRGRAGLL